MTIVLVTKRRCFGKIDFPFKKNRSPIPNLNLSPLMANRQISGATFRDQIQVFHVHSVFTGSLY